MDTGKFIGLLVFFLVGALVLVAFVPVIQETTSATNTITNEGVYNLTDDDSDYTLVYNGLSGTIDANGTIIQRDSIPEGSWTFISTPDYLIRLQNYAPQNYNLWLIAMDGTTSILGSNNTDGITITVNSGTITTPLNSYTYTGEFRGIDPNGKYVMTNGQPFTVNETDTIIVGNGTTLVTVWYDLFYMFGTAEDMEVTSNDTITISNIQVNSTPLTNYVGGVSVESITFSATDGTNSANATYNRVIVPEEVTLEKSIHPDTTLATVINLLPLIAGVGLLMFLVAEFLYIRYL